MEYAVYKLNFPGATHFGLTTLESAEITFAADRLFSALCFEAADEEELNRLVDAAKGGKLLFSDAFPYCGNEYYCIRPMFCPPLTKGDDEFDEKAIKERKIFKKSAFLPLSRFDDYLTGAVKGADLPQADFGKLSVKTSAAIYRNGDDTLPFRIGTFAFYKGCGLYVLVGYEEETDLPFAEDLLDRLSFSGIGGKRSAGLGRFELFPGKLPNNAAKRLTGQHEKYMTLSAALPKDDEIETALKDADYLLVKKSGFVASADYSPQWRRKRDSFAFKAGSCFAAKFAGQVKDVGNGGKHPVYRYLQPLFMGV